MSKDALSYHAKLCRREYFKKSLLQNHPWYEEILCHPRLIQCQYLQPDFVLKFKKKKKKKRHGRRKKDII